MTTYSRTTDYGFIFGPLEVKRLMSLDDGSVCVSINTRTQEIEVYSSPRGQSLRVFRKGKGEMKVPDSKAELVRKANTALREFLALEEADKQYLLKTEPELFAGLRKHLLGE